MAAKVRRRRPRGSGSVEMYITASGQRLWRIEYTHEGKVRQKAGFASELDALAAMPTFIQAIKDGTWRPRGAKALPTADMTLAAWMSEYLPQAAVLRGWRPSTLSNYTKTTESLIVPELGNVTLAKLTRAHIQRWAAGLVKRGLSNSSISGAWQVLRGALREAHASGLIARDVMSGLLAPKQPGTPERPLRTWSQEQARAFLAGTSATRAAPMWRVLLTSGVRIGELLGMFWSDLDLDAGTLTVRRTRVEPSTGYPTEYADPKTAAGRRTIRLDPVTVRALDAWRRQVLTERLAAGVGAPDPDSPVWVDEALRPMKTDGTRRLFNAEVKRLGLPRIRVHDGRHTAASLLLADGIPAKVVQERLGHSTISTTLDTYGHLMREQEQEAADRLGDLLGDG